MDITSAIVILNAKGIITNVPYWTTLSRQNANVAQLIINCALRFKTFNT